MSGTAKNKGKSNYGSLPGNLFASLFYFLVFSFVNHLI
jgi:hypothetical protein